jgi:glycosyltransferase involved in cell wall biosynthesis
VIGGGAQERLLRLKSDKVIFTGRVDDVRDFLKKCKVFVCPMTFGSGIKTKNLEAMAMGLPVVTSLIGAENINAKHGEQWFVEDTDDDFAKAVISLLEDQELREKVGSAGRKFVESRFSWEITKQCLDKLINN